MSEKGVENIKVPIEDNSKPVDALNNKKSNKKLIIWIIIIIVIILLFIIFALIFMNGKTGEVGNNNNQTNNTNTTFSNISDLENVINSSSINNTNQTSTPPRGRGGGSSSSSSGGSVLNSPPLPPCELSICQNNGNICGIYNYTLCWGTLDCACSNGFECLNSTCIELINCTSNDNCSYLNSNCGFGICGINNTCEVNYLNSTTLCRTPVRDCDEAEFCTGKNLDCPTDLNESNWTNCSEGLCNKNNFCDIEENCSSCAIDCGQCVNATYYTFSEDIERSHGIVYAKGKLFVSSMVKPSKLLRFENLYNLSNYSEIEFPNDGNHEDALDIVYSQSKDRIYILFHDYDNLTVSQINPDSLEYGDVISEMDFFAGGGSLAQDENNLYVLSSAPNTSILKYSLEDFQRLGNNTLDSENGGHALEYDGTHLYATKPKASTNGGLIFKINTSDLSFISSQFRPEEHFPTDDFAFNQNYVFVGLEFYSGIILRINKSNISSIDRIDTGLNGSIWCVFFDGNYIWALHAKKPGKLTRINPDTLEMKRYEIESPAPNEIATDNTSYFITSYVDPLKITRIDQLYEVNNSNITTENSCEEDNNCYQQTSISSLNIWQRIIKFIKSF